MNSTSRLVNDYQTAIKAYQKREQENKKSIEETGFPIHAPTLMPQLNFKQWEEAKNQCTEKNSDYHVWTYSNRTFYLYCDNDGKYWCYTILGNHTHIEPYPY